MKAANNDQGTRAVQVPDEAFGPLAQLRASLGAELERVTGLTSPQLVK